MVCPKRKCFPLSALAHYNIAYITAGEDLDYLDLHISADDLSVDDPSVDDQGLDLSADGLS